MRTSATGAASDQKVALLGFGTIGKRVADAVLRIPALQLAGIGVKRAVPALAPMIEAGIPIYSSEVIAAPPLEEIRVGEVRELLDCCDIVLDCTPRGTGARLRSLYEAAGIRVIYQGGELSHVAASTYCSGIGFEDAKTAASVRVLSCNTTGLTRIAQCLHSIGPVGSIRAVLTRSAADPDKSAKGMPNLLVASPGESHHGSDIRDLWPALNIRTLASYAPVNCGHLVSLFSKMQCRVCAEEVLSAFASAPRIKIVDGEGSLADLRHVGARLARHDCHDVIIWRDGIEVRDEEISLSAGIHMESIVVPETLDVLFAMTGLEDDPETAMRRSDAVVCEPVRSARKHKCSLP